MRILKNNEGLFLNMQVSLPLARANLLNLLKFRMYRRDLQIKVTSDRYTTAIQQTDRPPTEFTSTLFFSFYTNYYLNRINFQTLTSDFL